MIARLWAQQIIDQHKTFNQVPVRLKDQVREILIELNREDLIQ